MKLSLYAALVATVFSTTVYGLDSHGRREGGSGIRHDEDLVAREEPLSRTEIQAALDEISDNYRFIGTTKVRISALYAKLTENVDSKIYPEVNTMRLETIQHELIALQKEKSEVESKVKEKVKKLYLKVLNRLQGHENVSELPRYFYELKLDMIIAENAYDPEPFAKENLRNRQILKNAQQQILRAGKLDINELLNTK